MAQYKQVLNKRTGQFNLLPSTIIVFKASVANYAALPAVGNTTGDARITEDTDHWYSWDGSVWNDQGIFIASNWNNINGRPSSAVVDIDDAVNKKHTQNTDLYLDTQVTNTLYVDNKRTDIYTPNGSITKPFKTIQAAHDAITGSSTTNRFEIRIATGTTYDEVLSLSKPYIILTGEWQTRLTGAITITSPWVIFQKLRMSGAVTLNQPTNFTLEVKDCSVSTGVWNITASAPTGNEYLQIFGGLFSSTLNIAGVTYVLCWGGGIWGNLNLTGCYFQMAGTELNGNGNIINLETGTEAHIGGILSSSLTVNLKSGATLYADAGFLGAITLNNTGGTLHLTTKAADIKNIPAGTISSTNVQDAINELDTEVLSAIKSTAGGDYKKVTSIEYNPITGELRVSYEE